MYADLEAGGLLPIQVLPSDTQVCPVAMPPLKRHNTATLASGWCMCGKGAQVLRWHASSLLVMLAMIISL